MLQVVNSYEIMKLNLEEDEIGKTPVGTGKYNGT